MEVHCPFCQFHIVIKGVKPGGYRPPCPRCKQHFVMVVALVEGHRLVLLGETLEALAPVHGLQRVAAAETPDTLSQGAAAAGRADADQAAQATVPGQPPPGVAVADARATVSNTPAADPPTSAGHRHPPADASATVASTHTGPPPPHPARPVTNTAKTPRPNGNGNVTATAGRSVSTPAAPTHDTPELTGRLDGYELVKLLGRGGMGSVYLGRQLSLDRLVAIKTINPQWANDPIFLSRFTREAFAAAQLSHHNVVQIHDIGDDDGTHFFSMEYVEGRSLADLLTETGKLDVEEAAGYILHAARGLRFAHDHGMVHRDIKPANLLLNDEGVVKVADLGLVKTADDAGLTRSTRSKADAGADVALTSPTAMGTPAYMAPEQITDPSKVDGRADIYSLGCTFYALTTGRPIFQGDSAEEVMSKHATEAVIPPERIARRVPPTVSKIILSMVAKSPDERVPSMRDVIEMLERFLGIAAGPFTPREEHARTLEEAVEAFYASPLARLRRALVVAFSVACMVVAGWSLVTGRPTWLILAAGVWLFTCLSYATLTGLLHKTVVAGKVRQLLWSLSLRDWVFWPIVLAVLAAAVVFLDLYGVVLAALLGGVALAVGFYFGLDWPVAREREPSIQAVRQMLKQLRLRGLEEEAVRRFVCRYSGRDWEEFYECLFGYEAKLEARRHWGVDDQGKPRRRYGTWRDGLIQWIDHRQEKREQARRAKLLHRIEIQRARAEGKTEWEARWEAETVSQGMIARAEHYKQTGDWQSAAELDADKPRRAHHPDLWNRVIRLVPGARTRLAAGVALLTVYAIWMRDAGLLQQLNEGTGLAHARQVLNQQMPPLERAWLPMEIAPWLCTHMAGLAGLLLAVSVFLGGRMVTVCLIPAVALLIAGPSLPVPATPQFSQIEITMALGFVLAWVGIWIGRRS